MLRFIVVVMASLFLSSCATDHTYMSDLFSPGLQKAMDASKKGNPEQGVVLMKAEAERGNGIAQSMMARVYGSLAEKNGPDKGSNLVEAYKWIELACNKGVLYDKMPTDKADDIAYRDQLAKWMTSEQLSAGKKLAAEWQPKGP
jgi:hypothetical protein